ncbi:hypothetical protein J8273_3141 [Carpediemonas membranifera]|uniref:Uncharacterized protein n=1 Tax=Carpediemonas membranifera TaxID=201153 RepID=A0A8J6AVZ5_9EUKA|nr:hypothetical protein J8273_3141 [Carpediemonas membranifera]|eukprot:KAG9395563.1 hypothetical protein J8273_3141 [Carpediemonas membranifera]
MSEVLAAIVANSSSDSNQAHAAVLYAVLSTQSDSHGPCTCVEPLHPGVHPRVSSEGHRPSHRPWARREPCSAVRVCAPRLAYLTGSRR